MTLLVLRVRELPQPIAYRVLGPSGSLLAIAAKKPGQVVAVVGPRGGSGMPDINAVAATPIGGLKAVGINSLGEAYLADKDFSYDLVGVSMTAAAARASITIRFGGYIDDLSWNWSQGPVWLGNNGQLTQEIPTTGSLVKIGFSAGATRLIVQPEFVAKLN